MEILGTTIDNLTREEILAQIKIFLDEPKFHQIATVNPEFLLEAKKNKAFHTILQNCDLRIADGFGITLTMLFRGERLKCRFPGADLMEEILSIANEKKISIYLAIKKDGLSSFDEVRQALLERYPTLVVDGDTIDVNEIYDLRFKMLESKIKNLKSKIILCNFGSPTQEIFLSRLRQQTRSVRLAMGVGGSFDYLTKKQKRAPRWLQSIGLEWLWRLIQQPQRWYRIWNAVVLFPFYVFFATIQKHDHNT
ncbi:MAG: WecB/TagA/CpsF family glycosyltransferase [Candidatus Moranbacteria bacterium]|nr:WecB/TagA/CpsF family glycosyltransferase [Candidatus Moranbacteria bacterium]MDD3965101.1 WecB/TagA/CpsF family glycosyltransferase [Candidatus Moranbacteria bacterium]